MPDDHEHDHDSAGEQSALLLPVPAAEAAVGEQGGPAALRTAADAVAPFLPIQAAATEVILMAGPAPGHPDAPPGQWRPLASFALREPG